MAQVRGNEGNRSSPRVYFWKRNTGALFLKERKKKEEKRREEKG
jgi:hypothetical protein